MPSTDPAAAEWRVLAEGLWLPELPFAVRAALSQEALEGLWLALGQAGRPPDVDFAREAVLYMGISGSSSCPSVLEGLVVDHQNGRVFGQWRIDEQRACTDDLAPHGVLLAVRRDVLPTDIFLLSLQERPICPDCGTHPDQLFVDPSAPENGVRRMRGS